MSTRDFPPRPQGAQPDSVPMMNWLDTLGQRQNIDLMQALTSVASGDEIAIFDVSETGQVKTKKATVANILSGYPVRTTGTISPTLTFQTPGDLAISYAANDGVWTKIGTTVSLTFDLVSSSFTHTTASGAVLINGLPHNAISPYHFIGTMIVGGITKATYTQFVLRARSAFPGQMEVLAQGSGVASANVVAADMPTGGTVNFRGTIVYETA